jgi:hypothetical protein
MTRSSELRRIPDGHLRGVCRAGSAEATCRYIAGTPAGLQCAKHEDVLSGIIDERVAAGQMRAQGDNCPGIIEDNKAPDPTLPSSGSEVG